MKMPATLGRMAGPQLANDTKLGRILHIFLKGDSLNRFDAAAVGDSCLNSTISTFVHRYGLLFDRRRETVSNRFGGTTIVTRYNLAPDSYFEAIQLLAAK